MSVRGFLMWFCCLGLIASCSTTPDLSKLDHTIQVIGHGGAGTKSGSLYLPYNSMGSIQKGLYEFYADGIEVDVQLTKDEQLVLYHDQDLSKSTDCEGLIHKQPAEQCISCAYSVPLLAIGVERYQLVLLSDLLDYLNQQPKPPIVVLDLKLYPSENMEHYQQTFSDALVELIQLKSYTNKTLIESMHYDMLQKLQTINPELNLFLYAGEAEGGITKAQEMQLTGITLNYRLIDKKQVDEARKAGLQVAVFGAHTRHQNREAVALHPDYIQTDNIPYLVSLLENYQP